MTDQSIVKVCRDCNLEKPASEFPINRAKSDGIHHYCKQCNNERSRNYKHSREGVAAVIYHTQKHKSVQRGDLPPAYSRIEFRAWLLGHKDFEGLYLEWVASNYSRWLAPSADRLNDYKPYSFSNLRLVTWKENYDKGNADAYNGTNNKRNKAVLQHTLSGKLVRKHYSISSAGRSVCVGGSSAITRCCKGTVRQAYGFKWSYA